MRRKITKQEAIKDSQELAENFLEQVKFSDADIKDSNPFEDPVNVRRRWEKAAQKHLKDVENMKKLPENYLF